MSQFICVRLPYLRCKQKLPFRALRLCPGLPDDKVCDLSYQPHYPYKPAQAAAILTDMRGYGADELRQMTTLETGMALQGELGLRNELHEIARFAGYATTHAEKSELVARQAHKILLWRWLYEELHEEMAALESDYERKTTELAACFQDENISAPENRLEHVGLPEAGWRSVLANALVFLPDNVAIFAEGCMAEELLEMLDFQPAPEFAFRLGCPPEIGDKLLAASATAAHILGKPHQASASDQNSLYSQRIWLCWNAE